MIKILFDHQIFTEQAYGGISRYFKNLIDGIKADAETDYKLGVLYSNNYYIRDEYQPLKGLMAKTFFKSQRKILKYNNSYCKHLLKQNNFSVFHPTYFNPYFLKYLKAPLVITVHDMTYEALPQFFSAADPLPHYKRILMEKADKIIAISERTKTDILKYSNIKAHKIDVIHHGIDLNTPEYLPLTGLPQRYILFVGARWHYKNFYQLAAAFKILSAKYPDLYLVLAGGGPLAYGDTEFLMRNNILEKTLQVSANDEQLNTLYKDAQCFVYPSLYEGFGLPVLEAFKNSCPVILSDCSCFEEIAGQSAHYFDHTSLDSLVYEIEKVLDKNEVRAEMAKAGQKKLQEYSLKKCADKTLSLYQSVV